MHVGPVSGKVLALTTWITLFAATRLCGQESTAEGFVRSVSPAALTVQVDQATLLSSSKTVPTGTRLTFVLNRDTDIEDEDGYKTISASSLSKYRVVTVSFFQKGSALVAKNVWAKAPVSDTAPVGDPKLAEQYFQAGNSFSATKNNLRAFNLYLKAANLGSVPAEERVGWAYAKGTGTKVDLAKALWWLQKAATDGSEKADQEAGELRNKIDAYLRTHPPRLSTDPPSKYSCANPPDCGVLVGNEMPGSFAGAQYDNACRSAVANWLDRHGCR
jgi:Sel1 repeat-containing protein